MLKSSLLNIAKSFAVEVVKTAMIMFCLYLIVSAGLFVMNSVIGSALQIMMIF